jgi:hypothetical protein
VVTFVAFLPGRVLGVNFDGIFWRSQVALQATAAGGVGAVVTLVTTEAVTGGLNAYIRVNFPAGQAHASAQLTTNLKTNDDWVTQFYGPSAKIFGVNNGCVAVVHAVRCCLWGCT